MTRIHSIMLVTALSALTTLPAAWAQSPASSLPTVEVRQATIAREISFDGVLQAVNESTVAAQTSARVEDVLFDVGDYVKQGQVIIRFRATQQQAQLASAEAAVSEARARLAEAEQNYNRTKEIADRGLVAKATLDAATATLKSARARLDVALAGTRQAREGTQYTEVRAPFSGYVVKRHIEVGETATVGQPLMTGLSLDQLRAVVDIPQSDIGPLRKKGEARVILPDGKSLPATQLRFPPDADPTTHTFRVLVTLPEGDHGVYPGTLVKIAFIAGEKQSLLVPEAAVVRRSEVTAVYIIAKDGRIGFRYVRVGTPTADGEVPILAGVNAGEEVVTDTVAAAVHYKAQPPLPQEPAGHTGTAP